MKQDLRDRRNLKIEQSVSEGQPKNVINKEDTPEIWRSVDTSLEE